MSLAFSIKGTYKKGFMEDSAKFLAKVAATLSQYSPGMITGHNVTFEPEAYVMWGRDGEPRAEKDVALLEMNVHPAAIPVGVILFKPNHIVVNAETSGAGPGYHQFLCEALKAVAPGLKITWDLGNCVDPTGFFLNGNRDALESVYLRWLADQAVDLLDMYQRGAQHLSLSLPTPDRFFHDWAVATPLGPRPESWLETVSQDPSRGKDVFPWWDAGLGANYYLGRALSLLWMSIRFRPPMTETEQAAIQDMLNSFDFAYKAAPRLRYPYREWADFISMTERNDEIAQAVLSKAVDEDDQRRPLFGYRRRNYLAVFPSGWRITLPGSFAEAQMENGWQGWDDTRTVQIGVIDAPPAADGSKTPAEEIIKGAPPLGMGHGDDFKRDEEGLISKANLHRANEDGRQFYRLGSVSAVDGSMVNVTISFDEDEDREWAMGVWNSIHFVAPDGAAMANVEEE